MYMRIVIDSNHRSRAFLKKTPPYPRCLRRGLCLGRLCSTVVRLCVLFDCSTPDASGDVCVLVDCGRLLTDPLSSPINCGEVCVLAKG